MFLTLALAYVVLLGLEIWAVNRDRLDLAARLLTVAAVLALAVLPLAVIAIASRTWSAVAVWALNAALTFLNLRVINRMRAGKGADRVHPG